MYLHKHDAQKNLVGKSATPKMETRNAVSEGVCKLRGRHIMPCDRFVFRRMPEPVVLGVAFESVAAIVAESWSAAAFGQKRPLPYSYPRRRGYTHFPRGDCAPEIHIVEKQNENYKNGDGRLGRTFPVYRIG